MISIVQRLIGRLRRWPMLSVEELKQQIDSGGELLLLDVRTAEDYIGEQGHIAGSRNIPLEAVADHLGDLAEWQERPIALICRTDRRSAKAAAVLARNGFNEVRVVRTGMTAWNDAGWPVSHDNG
jgi:rhodanese-related sulfurtransferase